MESKSLSIQSSNNLLLSEGISKYHSARQVIVEYTSINSIENKRDIQNRTIDLLEDFLAYSYSTPEIEFINSILEDNARIVKTSDYSSLRLKSILEKADPQGIKLLKIEDDIDLAKLKVLYKRAAKEHHPDKGGNLKTMQAVNRTYDLFIELISQSSYFDSGADSAGSFVVSPKNIEDFIFSAHYNLAVIYADAFATDRLFLHLKEIQRLLGENSSPYVGHSIRVHVERSNEIYKICKSLARFEMRDELKEATQITLKLIERCVQDWVVLNESDSKPKLKHILDLDLLKSKFGGSITLRHLNQAENAFRLGKISRERYEKARKKFLGENDLKIVCANKVNSFISEYGFASIISNSNYSTETNTSSDSLTIAPYSSDRFELLQENQKAEYLSAFSKPNEGHLFEKYYDIRVNEILIGLIKNFSGIPIEKIIFEVNYFKDNFNRQFKKYEIIHEFIVHLNNLPDELREEKLNILSSLDSTKRKENGYIFAFLMEPQSQEKEMRIEVTNQYINFALQDLHKIREYKDGASSETEFDIAWRRDITLLRKFKETSVSKERELVWFSIGRSPEDVVRTSENYLKEILKLGEQFHPKNTGELQIGYEINRITTALVKLNKWESALHWSKLFFELPLSYRDRSTNSELKAIQKRMNRCLKKTKG
ncbi:MAG TPA: hypothetical protein VFC92_08490 [Bacteroidales bacterium]|nr:hypothetical protein [Bacteroidales bacterium]